MAEDFLSTYDFLWDVQEMGLLEGDIGVSGPMLGSYPKNNTCMRNKMANVNFLNIRIRE
jgi:hypothetical protein